MSKASDWAARLAAANAERDAALRARPQWFSSLNAAAVFVTDKGGLEMEARLAMTPSDAGTALSLGRWLVETFGP